MDELEGGSCERVYSDPTREKSKSAAELAVKALELRMKGIMLTDSTRGIASRAAMRRKDKYLIAKGNNNYLRV